MGTTDNIQHIFFHWPNDTFLLVTSPESAHLADPLLWGKVRAQQTNPTANGHHGDRRTALEEVRLALHYSMRH